MSFDQELMKKFNNNISNDTKLSNYSWFNLGGPAEYLFKPKDKSQLIKFLEENKKTIVANSVLGKWNISENINEIAFHDIDDGSRNDMKVSDIFNLLLATNIAKYSVA